MYLETKPFDWSRNLKVHPQICILLQHVAISIPFTWVFWPVVVYLFRLVNKMENETNPIQSFNLKEVGRHMRIYHIVHFTYYIQLIN